MNIIMSRALPHQTTNTNTKHRLPPTIQSPTSPQGFRNIPFSTLELSGEALGSGSFGTVYKGRWNGFDVAVKQFKTHDEISSFSVEVKQLSNVRHRNIVKLYGASMRSDRQTAYLVMEYAEGGSLNHLLHHPDCKSQQYNLRHACSWALQTARGVEYLHGIRPKPIMHRDLKPANLLLFKHGKILKICDFGTACTVKTQMTNNTGSASYMAPEVFQSSSYLESGDVFSWSIIFWEILARQLPYGDGEQFPNPFSILWATAQEGKRPAKLESCPKIIWDLIIRSWDNDPKKRPPMKQVVKEMEFIFYLTGRPNDSGDQHEFPQATSSTTGEADRSQLRLGCFSRPLPMAKLSLDQQQPQQTSSAMNEDFFRSRYFSQQPPHIARTSFDVSPNQHQGHQSIGSYLPRSSNSKDGLFLKIMALRLRNEKLNLKLNLLRQRQVDLEQDVKRNSERILNRDVAFQEWDELKREYAIRKSRCNTALPTPTTPIPHSDYNQDVDSGHKKLQEQQQH